MPDFEVDGKRYHVPFMSLIRPFGTSSDWFTCKAHIRVREKPPQAQPITPTIGWSRKEDQLLQEMRGWYISWREISLALHGRPVEALKERWAYLQQTQRKDRRNPQTRNGRNIDDGHSSDDDLSTISGLKKKTERHVEFSEPVDEMIDYSDSDDTEDDQNDQDDGDDRDDQADDSVSQPSKSRRVLYIDEDFSLQDVLLLHKIAAKWKRDRWAAISQAFTDKTGCTMTPEQAKSMLKEHVWQTDGTGAWGGGSG